jgi:hypothetical protein
MLLHLQIPRLTLLLLLLPALPAVASSVLPAVLAGQLYCHLHVPP